MEQQAPKRFDRSQFKAVSKEDMAEQNKEVKEKTKLKGDRAEILSFDKEGQKNRLRIFPKHPDTKHFSYPLHKHILKVTTLDKEGKPKLDDQGNIEIRGRAIFSALIHSDINEKDIINEYIQRVYKRAYDEIKDDATRKKFLSLITGWRTDKWNAGIAAMKSWIVYGNLNGKFGRVELPVSVKDKLNEVAAQQDMSADPFTDPDTGRMVFITFNKTEEDPKKKYSVSIDLSGPTPMTDDELDELMVQKPLEKIYQNTYTLKDFNRAIEGLKRFDEESADKLKKLGFSGGYEIFSYDDFLDTAEALAQLYTDAPSEDDEDIDEVDTPPFTPSETPTAINNKPTAIQNNEPVTPEPVQLNLNQPIETMTREELVALIVRDQLQIRVLPSYNEAMLRQFIAEERSMNSDPVASTPSEPIVPEVIEPAASTNRMDRINRLNNLAQNPQ